MLKRTAQIFPIMLLLGMTVTLSGASRAVAAPPQQSDKRLVDVLSDDGRFASLITALQAADLVDTLNGPGTFTLFAPTDEAFKALPAGTFETLLADRSALRSLLRYHIWLGQVPAAQVVKLAAADTILGPPVRIVVEGNTVKINEARVLVTDIQAANGVIHVIDAVLSPPLFEPHKPGYDRPRPQPEDPKWDYDQAPKHPQPDNDKHPPPYRDDYSHNYGRNQPSHNPYTYYFVPTPYGYKGGYYGGGYTPYGYYDYQGYTRWWHVPRSYWSGK